MQQEEARDKGQMLAALKRRAYQHGLSEDDAEDVLQQARLRYFLRRGVDYLDHAEPQSALMNKIIRGVIADHQRQHKRRQRAEHRFAAMHTTGFDENALFNQLLVKEILARLPVRWRKVAYWLLQGLSWREIAQRLNSQVGTVSVQFRRALDKACKELGIECRKKKLSSGIKDGSARKRKLPYSKPEVMNDETMDRLAFDSNTDGGRNDDCCSDPDSESSGGGGLAPRVATAAKLDKHVAIAVTSSIPLIRPHALTALLIAAKHPFAAQSMVDQLATPASSGGRSVVLGLTRYIARPTEMKNATPLLGKFPARGILV